jgi:hypothetical protein
MSAMRLENDNDDLNTAAAEQRDGEPAHPRVHALTMAMDALAAAQLLLGMNFSLRECGKDTSR